MNRNKQKLFTFIFVAVLAVALFASLVAYFTKPIEAATFEPKAPSTNILVENEMEGKEIRVLDDDLIVVKEIPKVEEEKEPELIDVLKEGDIPAPEIFRIYNINGETKKCTRTVMYELYYNEFLEKLGKYKEEGFTRFMIVPQAAFRFDQGTEILQMGYPIYSEAYVSKWASTSFYAQSLISLFPNIAEMVEEYGLPNDPYYNIEPYVDFGEYEYTYDDEFSDPEYGPYINFEEKTLKLKVRYCIMDMFTGDCYYSDYSEEALLGKEQPMFDIDNLVPIEFDDVLEVTTARVTYSPDLATGEIIPYLSIKIEGYESELDKALDKIGDVVAVLEIYDKHDFLLDRMTFDLAYMDSGAICYYFNWFETADNQINFDEVKCKVKLAYVYDITNIPDGDFPSESHWVCFSCK